VQIYPTTCSRITSTSAAGRLWRISTSSSFQARPDGVDALARLVEAAVGELGSPSTAIDLYSGLGLFAGILASRDWTVTAIDGSYGAVKDAKVNLGDLPVGPQGVEAVVGTGARRIVLLSCDAASLRRVAVQLQRSGYTMTAITYVDLFPHTFRVEVVSIFDRTPIRSRESSRREPRSVRRPSR
jgi:tRNA/tmRNA/rRNA uracil-C5-methylase (TrmA/RlmC/RlmD family)